MQTLEVPGYEVVRFLGTGARSTIWEVRDRQAGDVYALKRVLRRGTEDARFLEQAVNEFEVTQQLDHPVIRRIHDLRRVKKWFSLREIRLIMEYCEGTNVQDERPENVPETLRIFVEVAAALAYMNSRGFVHADMKPNNILVAPDGVVKIIDLGQSCPQGTVKKRIKGTPDFIAPEQVRRRPLDGRTDVYNFGAAFYWALTGRAVPTVLPRAGASTLKADMKPPPADQIAPGVPPALGKLINECLELRPARRPESMAKVASRLQLIQHAVQRGDRLATEEDL